MSIVYEAYYMFQPLSSSGLLMNQVYKCCIHAGIPTMFTIGFCRIYPTVD